MKDRLRHSIKLDFEVERMEPLFATEQDYEEFNKRQSSYKVTTGDLASYKGNCYLGIDAGSTTTKTALVGEDGSLLYSFYSNNNGSPLKTAIRSIQEIYSILPEGAKIAYACSTGDGRDYMIDIFEKDKVASMIEKAKADSDVLIFVAHWGKEMETMPTEYEKEWATFLMQQGVDVVIGGHPHILQPYGRMSDKEGHSMLIFYSLGNFVSTQESFDSLLEGMGCFTIQKTVQDGNTTIEITDPEVRPMVMHYNKDAAVTVLRLWIPFDNSIFRNRKFLFFHFKISDNLSADSDRLLFKIKVLKLQSKDFSFS